MTLRVALAALLCAAPALCQAPAPPVFDAASIKPSPPGRSNFNPILGDNIRITPGSLSMHHVTLKACIQWAYHVFQYQVTGPPFIDSTPYDIDAKTAGPVEPSDLRVMLQALLAARFGLKLHRQTKEMSALVLTVGKGGPKFHESAAEGGSDMQADQKTMRITVQRVSVSQIVDPLSRLFQMPVVDQTGLPGRYDVALEIAKYLPQAGDKVDPLSIIQTGLQEDLGLKLEQKKVPLDFLVVDKAAKSPTGN